MTQMKQTIKRISLPDSYTGPYGYSGLLCVLSTVKGLEFPKARLSPTKIVCYFLSLSPNSVSSKTADSRNSQRCCLLHKSLPFSYSNILVCLLCFFLCPFHSQAGICPRICNNVFEQYVKLQHYNVRTFDIHRAYLHLQT